MWILPGRFWGQVIPGNKIPMYLFASDKELLACPISKILQNPTLCSSPGSSLKQGRSRGGGGYSLAHMRLSTKTFSSECHQREMALGDIAAVTSEQPHPHQPGFFIQPQPSLTSLLNACGWAQPLWRVSQTQDLSNLCERPRTKQRSCRRIQLQKPAPLAGPGKAVIADNTFRISKREVIYPSQGRPRTAVMLCGCPGYAMMSFQRRNQRLASAWGGLVVVFVFFKLCLHFIFFCMKILPRDVSKLKSLPSPLAHSLLSRAGTGHWILTGKWEGHTVFCQPQRPLWPRCESLWREAHSLTSRNVREK